MIRFVAVAAIPLALFGIWAPLAIGGLMVLVDLHLLYEDLR